MLSRVAAAIELLRRIRPRIGCDSGGKDSCAIRELARLAGIDVSWHHNLTTLDAPELVGDRDDTLLMGIRAEESPARRRWRTVDWIRRRPRRRVVLPILGWDSEELWGFLREQKVPVCELYSEGWHRLGCIGCPLAHQSVRRRELDRWPKYRAGWQRAVQGVWQRRAGTRQRDGREWFGSACFSGWEELWEWWTTDRPLPVGEQLRLPGC